MAVYNIWFAACDNSEDAEVCKSNLVFGRPNEDKKTVILKAMNMYGFSTVKVVDSAGFENYYFLCQDCKRRKIYPRR